jgi:hypothetical protein
MQSRRFITTFVLGAAIAVGAAPSAAPAASGGWAWDSVTKFQMNGDQSSLQPGRFDDDFAKASAAQPEQPEAKGGLFGRMQQAIGVSQNMQALMSNGIAEHHYVAGPKERIDQIGQMTATITDCSARTITSLDLRKKTYRVTSMDARDVDTPSAGGGSPSPRATDDGTRVAMTIDNTALGARNVNGAATSGYRSNITMTETKRSGESNTQTANLLAYYSSQPNPMLLCYHGAGNASNMGSIMTAGYARLMRALALSGKSSRFSVKQSGPAMPLGSIAMWDAVTFSNEGTRAATVISERANLHPIDANDPAFAIPAGFQEQK